MVVEGLTDEGGPIRVVVRTPPVAVAGFQGVAQRLPAVPVGPRLATAR